MLLTNHFSMRIVFLHHAWLILLINLFFWVYSHVIQILLWLLFCSKNFLFLFLSAEPFFSLLAPDSFALNFLYWLNNVLIFFIDVFKSRFKLFFMLVHDSFRERELVLIFNRFGLVYKVESFSWSIFFHFPYTRNPKKWESLISFHTYSSYFFVYSTRWIWTFPPF